MKTTRPRFARTTPWLRSFDLWSRFAEEQTTMMWTAAEVVGRRTTRMAAHGIAPDAHERRELRTMVEEKQSAVIEGSMAAWQEWMRLGQASWLEAIRHAMKNGSAFTPMLTSRTPLAALASGQRGARRTAARSLASTGRHWAASLDASLRIADAALQPARTRVAANHRRLSVR